MKAESDFCLRFPDVDFRDVHRFQTAGEPVLITDPTYLADVYNSDDDSASYLRAHGVFVSRFGGDTSGPVWWQSPFLLLPISVHLSNAGLRSSLDITVLAEEVGTDSGSFIFLPLADDLLQDVRVKVDSVLAHDNGAALSLPAGSWSVFYEQWEDGQGQPSEHYRNIVAKWEPGEIVQPRLFP